MSSGIRALYFALGISALLAPHAAPAEPHWIKARLGAFEAVSDDGRRSATQALSQFEQFSFALGTAMGQPDLRLDPPLLIIVFKNAQEMRSQCPPGLAMGRNRLMACTTSEGQLPQSLLRDLTRTLLENNFARVPAPIQKALESFFGTVESNAVKVTWGAPPPPPERTREWTMLHFILTQPDFSGRAKIYLHNLTAGMDTAAASRNAFGEEGPKFEADLDRYYKAGVFNTAAAPNRPLNPERDFKTTFLTTDEGDLMRADLLNPASAGIYQSLLKAGKHLAEDNEGLAALALRQKDDPKFREYMEGARKAGTTNFVMLTEYAKTENDPDKAVEILKEALTVDPKYAEAHWIFGEKVSEPARRIAEWKQAVSLAPGKHEWWAQYAQLCVDQKQYAEAGRAWMAAAQAAPDPQLREQYLTSRGRIEQQRLDAEDQERRKTAAEKAREIEDLKAQARKELAAAEARANANPLSSAEVAKAVDWYGDSGSAKVSGVLLRVDCNGKQLRLSVKDDAGKTQVLLVPDTGQFEIKGGQTLACGAQKARRVTISYKPAQQPLKGARGSSGEATAMELQP
ncbi:MAG TPA: hypothetical protein VK789_25460 [Bryobacteraceae bacterium]|nr:hypothetical protein [Bryobacteraceae bacterium]